ncbi:failed axon connections homolog isoform X2 [Penaeus monodon]|uniref:failed axon connections homolog isoform X2 n=1 Tax=Penaeus monodon TaxID=6687 RepID=UPI0018A7885D|nr:failed axon connections homolog isoform X2 [Penaeus monodon]
METSSIMWASTSVITFVVMVTATLYLYNYLLRKNRRFAWGSLGRDVVVLHITPRGRFAPNMSPFVIKLETFLRLAKIPYKVDFEEPFGPKGKTPWITLNDEELTDSQLVMEELTRHYELTDKLSVEQQAVARALTVMVDEHLIWGLRVWRYDVDRGRGFSECMSSVPFYYKWFVPIQCWRMRNALWHQGMGRHTYQEVKNIVKQDLAAIAGCLDDFPKLSEYVSRVRAKLWPNWYLLLDPAQPQRRLST